MILDFNNRKEDYKSFGLNKGVNKAALLEFYKISEAFTSLGTDREAHDKTKIITEKLSLITDIKPAFIIDNVISVDFNKEQPYLIKNIIDDFLMKSKFKKYKSLLLWVPLLQDHYWCNDPEPPRKEKIKRGKSYSERYLVPKKSQGFTTDWKSFQIASGALKKTGATVNLKGVAAKIAESDYGWGGGSGGVNIGTYVDATSSWYYIDEYGKNTPVVPEPASEAVAYPRPDTLRTVRPIPSSVDEKGARVGDYQIESSLVSDDVPPGHRKVTNLVTGHVEVMKNDLYQRWRYKLYREQLNAQLQADILKSKL